MSDYIIPGMVVEQAEENGYTGIIIPEEYNRSAYPFRPVRCTEQALKNLIKPEHGFLYFTTDTKKIFMGHYNEFLPMCASSGIFYGQKLIIYENTGITPDPNVSFGFDEIEGDEIPEINDLILNIGTAETPDGCFYRVLEIGDELIRTTRLTLQGSGGGGGSSTGSSFSATIVGNTNLVYASTASEMPVTFKANYFGAEENSIVSVSLRRKSDEEPFYISLEEKAFNKEYTINLVEYKHLLSSLSKTTIYIEIQDAFGTTRSPEFTAKLVELSISSLSKNLVYSFDNQYSFPYGISGGSSDVSNKEVVFTFYNENNLDNPVGEPQIAPLNASDEGTFQKKLDLSGLPHGIYVLKIQANVTLTNSNKVYSNILTYKIARFDVENGTPLLMIMLPEETEQYSNIPLDYLLLTPESNKDYTLQISLNEKEEKTLNIQSNVFNSYNLYFERQGEYYLECLVPELNLVYQTVLNIASYTGELPVIDPTRDDLMLYLNPKGQSNSDSNKHLWQDYNKKYTAELTDQYFNSSNGWLIDEEGVSYLQMSPGAQLTIPDFKPFNKDWSKDYGFTIELDFEISGVLDYNSSIIECLSTSGSGSISVGFKITGDRIRFYSSRTNLITLNLVEGKRIRVSFVVESRNPDIIEYPMCFGYLNGVLSNAVLYKTDDSFIDSINDPAIFKIDATNASVKIYGIRFYNNALNNKFILNNFTASLPTLKEREERYKTNNVFSGSTGKVSFDIVSGEDYDLQIPYMKITGGYATELESKWQLKDVTSSNVGLPTGKKDYRLIDIEVKYPDNAYFKNYEDYKFINKFKDDKPMSEAYGEKPTNGGCIMYAQGTSSMEYPVKNLRIRFKNKDDFYTVRPDISAVEIICMKADYMESSGSHNTGTANLVDALYQGRGMKTPGQEHFGGEDKDTIVTCIKGHPCLIFYSPSGEPGTYEYIGKYNLNLDKATPEPFGFAHDDTNFGYLNIGDEYYDIPYNEEGEYIGTSEKDEIKKEVQEGEKINSIHCFEFLDNAVEVCNFRGKASAYIKDEVTGELKPDPTKPRKSYRETWYNTFTNSDNKQVPGWTLGFESRYPEDKVGYHDADSLYPLASWLNGLYEKRVQEEEAGMSPNDITYIYEYTKAEEYEEFVAYYIQITEGEYVEAYPTEETFADGVYYTREMVDYLFAMESLERFKREYKCYLNKDFLLTYYLVTEALLMADSRVKNMMIATWGKEEGKYIDYETGEEKRTNNYIFYPIFYDMDTMLGLDNTGVYRFNYYDEDTDPSIYNGEEILWNFVRDALKNELDPWYTELEDALLTSGKILPYYNENQANMANEAFYNGDAVYKYIDYARNGYKDDLNNKDIAPGVGPYLYAAQGDRSLMREWFLTNRMSFLSGKRKSRQFQENDRIEFRWYYPTNADIAVPPSGEFKFTSIKTGYAGVKLGANGNVYAERFNGEETKPIILPEASAANGTEAYLLGLSTLSDLGDLSNKYMQKFIINSKDVRLKKLTLGNPTKGYKNPYWTPKEGQTAEIDISKAVYLEEFNLQNCEDYKNVLNFSNNLAIKKILLTGSGVNGLTLPLNGVLEELRIPPMIKDLKIESHTSLTKENFSMGTYDYVNGTKIGDGIGHYVDDYWYLEKLYIVDTPIDTYKIVTNAPNLSDYYLQNVDWVITDDISLNINNDIINMVNNNQIIAIPVLDFLYTRRDYDEVGHENALTGQALVNIPNTTVNEFDIYLKYQQIYPNLNILFGNNVAVNKAYTVNFYTNDNLNAKPYYSVKTNGNYTWAQLTSEEGPAGKKLEIPVMTSTPEKDFVFTGIWVNANNPDKKYNIEDFELESPLLEDFTDYVLNLIPEFESVDRRYSIELYDDDGTTLIYKGTQIWNGIVGNIEDIPLAYNYKAPESLADNQRYHLKGWSKRKNNSEVYDIYNHKVTGNIIAYAVYEIVDIYSTPMNLDCFNFYNTADKGNGDNIYTYLNVDNNEIEITGLIIGLKDIYKNKIQGPLTLPKSYNNELIKILGHKTGSNFREMPYVTHIYFEDKENCGYEAVGDYCFSGTIEANMNSKLIKVDLPPSIRVIGERAFTNLINLREVSFNDNLSAIGDYAFAFSDLNKESYMTIQIDKLPINLKTLGTATFSYGGQYVTINKLPEGLTAIPGSCFNRCEYLQIDEIPGNIKSIGTYSFAYCKKINISIIPASVKKIQSEAFAYAGDEVISLIIQMPSSASVNLDPNEYYIQRNAFTSYSNAALDLYFVGQQDDYSLTPADMGFTTEKITWGYSDMN